MDTSTTPRLKQAMSARAGTVADAAEPFGKAAGNRALEYWNMVRARTRSRDDSGELMYLFAFMNARQPQPTLQ